MPTPTPHPLPALGTPLAGGLYAGITTGTDGAAYALIGDFDALGGRLLDLAWWALPGAAGLSLLNYAVRFARWQVYLRAQEVVVPRGDSAAVFLAGLSLAISPGKLGELFKSYLLRALHGAPVARTAPIVLAERVTDLTALVVLALIGVALYGVAAILIVSRGPAHRVS